MLLYYDYRYKLFKKTVKIKLLWLCKHNLSDGQCVKSWQIDMGS